MDLLLQRHPAVTQSILGDLFVDGLRKYVTLERVAVAIPIGRYQVLVTVSARASRGELWSPDPHHRLPLLAHVPSREGIRLHAGNFSYETMGCVLVGTRAAGDHILESRAALTALLPTLIDAVKLETVWIDVMHPQNPDRQVWKA